MSYYTLTHFSLDESDSPSGDLSHKQILAAAGTYLDTNGYSRDVPADLAAGLDNDGIVDPGFTDLLSHDIIGRFRAISATFPGVMIAVRGMGEEHFDIWAARIRNGEIVAQHGPFTSEDARVS
jgi:hypothetical protein